MNLYKEEVKIIFKNAEKEAINLNNKYIETYHIILAILKYKNMFQKSLLKEININTFYNEIKMQKNTKYKDYITYSNEVKNIIENIIIKNEIINNKLISTNNIILEIISTENKCTNILKKLNANLDKILNDIKKMQNNSENLTILKIGKNLNTIVSENNIIYNREKEINKIIEILAKKNKNNPLLIGEAGTGKTAIIEYLAYKINKKEVPNFLKDKIIVSISMAELVAGTKYRGEFEEKLINIIKELEYNDNIILFIDEIHTIINAGGAEGAIDAANIMKPALARGKIKCIGATTINEYKKSIENDKALERRFQKVLIKEPNEKETLDILKKVKKNYEEYHNIIISNDIIKQIVKLSNKYIPNKNQPDKSLDILDQVCTKEKIINNIKENKRNDSTTEKIKKAIKKNDYKNLIKLKQKKYNLTPNAISLKTLKNTLEESTNCKIIELENISKEREKIKKELRKKIPKEAININEFTNKMINNNNVNSFICDSNNILNILEQYSKITKSPIIKITSDEFSNDYSVNKITEEKYSIFNNININPNSIIYIYDTERINDKVLSLLLKISKDKYLLTESNKIYFNLCKFIFVSENNPSTTNFLANKTDNNDYNIKNKIIYKKTP